MPWNVKRTATLFEKEILRSAAGLDDIKSMVVDSTKVIQNPAASGRYVLEAGTVMVTIAASSKIQPANAVGAVISAATVVGILETTIEFWVGQGVVAGSATDEPAAILHHGCDFNVTQLVAYTGNEAAVKAALPTCIFR